jgi:hypothetical protein
MGDIGTALSGLGSGLSDAFSGVGGALSSGASDIGGAMSSMFSGSAAPDTSGTGPGSSFTQAVDPTGSIAAQEAINPPGQAPTAPQNQQNQQGQQPPKPAAQQPDQERQGGLDQLRKLLQRARGVSPYQTGAGAGSGQQPQLSGYGPKSVPEGPVQDPLMPSPLGQAGSIDTSGVPPAGGPLGLAPGESGEGVGSSDQLGPLARNPRAAAAGQNAVATAQPRGVPAVQPPEAPEIGPGSAAAAGGLPLGKIGPLGAAAAVMRPTPAETGELPPTAANIPPDQRNMPYPGQQYAPDPSIVGANPPQQPKPGDAPPPSSTRKPGEGNIPSPGYQGADDATKPATKAEYEKWLKAQGVKPSAAKKKADDSNLPTKKPHEAPPTTIPQHGVSNITRDRAGMQGVPQMLGELAHLAMPLISMAMSGGFGGGGGRGRFRGFPFGRGGHGRFGGQWRGGHPGGFGSGMWPYHHPGMGWSGFNHHPGGGWMPLHPKYMASMGGQVGGNAALGYGDGGGQDQMQQILQALGLTPPGGQGQGQGGGFRQGGRFGGGGSSGGGGASGGYGGSDNYSPPTGNGPWTGNPFLTTLVGAESGGDNNAWGDRGNGNARGIYQIQDATWREFAPGVQGAGQYGTANQAPPEVQQAVASSIPISRFGDRTRRILHAQFGNFNEHMTVGELSQQFGGGTRTAASTPPGTVGSGDPRAPNPNGNVVQRNFDNSPMSAAG